MCLGPNTPTDLGIWRCWGSRATCFERFLVTDQLLAHHNVLSGVDRARNRRGVDARRDRTGIDGRIDAETVDLVHLVVDEPNEREEGVDDGVEEAVGDPVGAVIFVGKGEESAKNALGVFRDVLEVKLRESGHGQESPLTL